MSNLLIGLFPLHIHKWKYIWTKNAFGGDIKMVYFCKVCYKKLTVTHKNNGIPYFDIEPMDTETKNKYQETK